jgi:hypothetical protein|uniref:Uncharacterized protein n=1 Tax=Picea glauca TaxID=3330 RepID=A0A124GNC4_PICGL|nr:hypothetical protein ABT39_MTgene5348 [Picea glauca]
MNLARQRQVLYQANMYGAVDLTRVYLNNTAWRINRFKEKTLLSVPHPPLHPACWPSSTNKQGKICYRLIKQIKKETAGLALP